VGLRYNPPPGWPPAPEGFNPQPGWKPDPSWPPPPPGWPLWVNDDQPSVAAWSSQGTNFSPQNAPAQPAYPAGGASGGTGGQYGMASQYRGAGPAGGTGGQYRSAAQADGPGLQFGGASQYGGAGGSSIGTGSQHGAGSGYGSGGASTQYGAGGAGTAYGPGGSPYTAGSTYTPYEMGQPYSNPTRWANASPMRAFMSRRVLIPIIFAAGFAIVSIAFFVWSQYLTNSEAIQSGNGQIKKGGNLSVFSLAAGDCFDNPASPTNIASVSAIPCNQPHNAQVYAIFDLFPQYINYPGNKTMVRLATRGCNARTGGLSKSANTSGMSVNFIYPTASSWNNAQNSAVNCIIVSNGNISRSLLNP
jgi:hypothetical protein